jgi:SAM-dependent methyltransferase
VSRGSGQRSVQQGTDVARVLRERVNERYRGAERDNYLVHVRRYATSLDFIPDETGRLIDMGSSVGLFTELVREHRRFDVETEAPNYNFEIDPAPYAADSFNGVLLMEVLEHFAVDPMYALSEINRIVKRGGFLFLTTPNIASWRAMRNIVEYRSPYLFGIFTRDRSTNRHNREYSVAEVRDLVIAAGFDVERLDAITVYDDSESARPLPGVPAEMRGDTTFCLARKVGLVRDRYPSWLYWS